LVLSDYHFKLLLLFLHCIVYTLSWLVLLQEFEWQQLTVTLFCIYIKGYWAYCILYRTEYSCAFLKRYLYGRA